MFHYITIDEDGLVTGESWLSGEISDKNNILVDEDFNPIGKRYQDGEWVPYTPEPNQFTDLLDENSQMQLEMVANIQYIADLMEINNL